MQVIVFASQKGGSGKTTLAGHMAVMADAAGLGPVAMLDTDPQGSLAQWWNARQADTPLFVRSSLTELPETLEALDQRGMALVCIDTPPAITVAIRSVVENADLVVVPVRPSPHDLRAAGATVDLVEGLERPFVFVVNGASSRARITSDAAIALSQHGTVAPVTVHNRTEFAASMSDGRTVMEINPEGRSAEEMAGLWRYLRDRLSRISARQADQPPARTHAAFSAFVRESFEPRTHAPAWGESVGVSTDQLGVARSTAAPAPAPVLPPLDGVDSAAETALPRPIPIQDEDDGFDDDPTDANAWTTAPATAPQSAAPTAERLSRQAPVPVPAPPSPTGARPRHDRVAMVAHGNRPAPVPAQGRAGGLMRRHAFGRRSSAEI